MPKKSQYKIGEACRELDIQPYVLRYWETEFVQLREGASGGGQRTYSAEELGIIRRIKELLYEEGYTIAGAKKKLDSEVADGVLAASGEEPSEAPPEAELAKPKAKKKAKKVAAASPPAETEARDDSVAQRLELLRSDLEVLRDEARAVASELRGESEA
ncbi:MAG: MerR family transcriptional regulator [Acidobacteriota bacterium]